MAYTGGESSAWIRTQSLTRTKTQELIASHKERDINPQDDRWEGSIDQAADGSFLRRPRRRTTSPGQKVVEKDEWELADEVSSSRETEQEGTHAHTWASFPTPRSAGIEPI
jgi:hypothetical protein